MNFADTHKKLSTNSYEIFLRGGRLSSNNPFDICSDLDHDPGIFKLNIYH